MEYLHQDTLFHAQNHLKHHLQAVCISAYETYVNIGLLWVPPKVASFYMCRCSKIQRTRKYEVPLFLSISDKKLSTCVCFEEADVDGFSFLYAS